MVFFENRHKMSNELHCSEFSSIEFGLTFYGEKTYLH